MITEAWVFNDNSWVAATVWVKSVDILSGQELTIGDSYKFTIKDINLYRSYSEEDTLNYFKKLTFHLINGDLVSKASIPTLFSYEIVPWVVTSETPDYLKVYTHNVILTERSVSEARQIIQESIDMIQ